MRRDNAAASGGNAGTVIAGVVMVVAIGFLLFELPALRNTLGAFRLAALAAIPGVLLFALAAPLRRAATIRPDEKFRATMLFLVASLACSAALLSHVNHAFGRAPASAALLVLDKQHERSSKGGESWKLVLRYGNGQATVHVPPAQWQGVQPGQTYPASVQRGALGFVVLACGDHCR